MSNEPDSVVVSTGKGMFRSTDKGDHFEPVSEGLGTRTYTSTSLITHPNRPGYMLSGVTAVGPGRWRRPVYGHSSTEDSRRQLRRRDHQKDLIFHT